MDFLLGIAVALGIYISFVLIVSLIISIIYIKKGRVYVKEKFKETFLHFLLELFVPLNWF